jgi:hypothetical protein
MTPPRGTTAADRPERDPSYDALSLEDLRQLRVQLDHEQSQVDYWRRIIQTRVDVLRTQSPGREPLADLDKVLAAAHSTLDRLALLDVQPVGHLPPLPELAELWTRPVSGDDPIEIETLRGDLREADVQLASYHTELRRRAELASGELIARYHQDPQLALHLLPRRRRR